jgi:hypothetical protein
VSHKAPGEDIHATPASAVASSRLGALAVGEKPTGQALWAAVGKSRGVAESLTPGVGFLSVYTLTANVLLSVAAPVVLAVVFIVLRVAMKSPVAPAIAGLLGITASASVALLSGRAEDNFLLGFGVNGLWIAALIISLVARRPLTGVLFSLLQGASLWRDIPAIMHVSVLTTVMWVGIFGLRLVIQLPLYFSGEVGALALAKLVLGIPLYAAGLWFTWLLFRPVLGASKVTTG